MNRSSCTISGPRAWIDFPRDGSVIPAGATVVVVSHANADAGVAEVLLSVDGVALRRDPPTTPGETLVEIRQEWIPADSGVHTVQVQAIAASGAAGGTDVITVRIEGEVPFIGKPGEVRGRGYLWCVH